MKITAITDPTYKKQINVLVQDLTDKGTGFDNITYLLYVKEAIYKAQSTDDLKKRIEYLKKHRRGQIYHWLKSNSPSDKQRAEEMKAANIRFPPTPRKTKKKVKKVKKI
jgi:hypothetical protein